MYVNTATHQHMCVNMWHVNTATHQHSLNHTSLTSNRCHQHLDIIVELVLSCICQNTNTSTNGHQSVRSHRHISLPTFSNISLVWLRCAMVFLDVCWAGQKRMAIFSYSTSNVLLCVCSRAMASSCDILQRLTPTVSLLSSSDLTAQIFLFIDPLELCAKKHISKSFHRFANVSLARERRVVLVTGRLARARLIQLCPRATSFCSLYSQFDRIRVG